MGLVLYGIDREGAAWSIDLRPRGGRGDGPDLAREPRLRRLAETMDARLDDLVVLRRATVLQAVVPAGGVRLWRMDRRSGAITEIGTLDLDPVSPRSTPRATTSCSENAARDQRRSLVAAPCRASSDIRQVFQLTSYRWRPGSTKLLAFGPGLGSSVTWDYDGRPLDRDLNPHFGFEFSAATQLLISGFDNRETFAGKEFRIRAAQLQVSSSWLKWIDVAGFFQRGTRINYAPAAGLSPFLGETTDAFARVTVRPAARVALEQGFIFARLQLTVASDGPPHSGRIFANHLARPKVSLQLTRELSLRAILDYARISSDQRLTAIESGTRVSADFLATFQWNPWTALYVGYTEGLEDVGAGRAGVLGLRRTAGLYRTDRQVFAKASYVVRF